MASSKGKCNHGEVPGDKYPDITVSGKDEEKVAAHDRKCPVSHPFWHHGFLFKVICCAGCGRKIL